MTNFGKWLKAAGVRALKTVAQTAVATIGTTRSYDLWLWRLTAPDKVQHRSII